MKKMMIYLLATGIGISTCYIPFKANAEAFGKHHKMKKEEREMKREAKEKRWEDNAMMMNYNSNAYPVEALPVDEDFVPGDVVNTMKNAYGPSLYDITTVKCSNGTDCYAVRVIGTSGVAETVIVNGDNTPAMQ